MRSESGSAVCIIVDAMSVTAAVSNRNHELRNSVALATATTLAAFSISGVAQTASVHSPELAKGVVIAKAVTLADANQSYALFLPSYYSPGRKWPIIYAFDPEARGHLPVELMKDAAEKYGYIVV